MKKKMLIILPLIALLCACSNMPQEIDTTMLEQNDSGVILTEADSTSSEEPVTEAVTTSKTTASAAIADAVVKPETAEEVGEIAIENQPEETINREPPTMFVDYSDGILASRTIVMSGNYTWYIDLGNGETEGKIACGASPFDENAPMTILDVTPEFNTFTLDFASLPNAMTITSYKAGITENLVGESVFSEDGNISVDEATIFVIDAEFDSGSAEYYFQVNIADENSSAPTSGEVGEQISPAFSGNGITVEPETPPEISTEIDKEQALTNFLARTNFTISEPYVNDKNELCVTLSFENKSEYECSCGLAYKLEALVDGKWEATGADLVFAEIACIILPQTTYTEEINLSAHGTLPAGEYRISRSFSDEFVNSVFSSEFTIPTTVNVTHNIMGDTFNRKVIGENADKLRTWASELKYELIEFESGQTPGDNDGGETYHFVFNDGGFTDFSYVINGADGCYLLIDNDWYSVSNPSNPPLVDAHE